MKYSAQNHVFLATFHVVSRKVDFRWDSVAERVEVLVTVLGYEYLTVQVNPAVHQLQRLLTCTGTRDSVTRS